MYLGLVGQIASGKGEVVKILTEKYGFTSFNLSSILHTILEEKGVTNYTRADLQNLGDKLRKEEGEGVLAKRAVKQLHKIQILKSKSQTKRIIIEGIRNPAEINYLRTLPNFKLIAVKAKQRIRFERLKKRGKSWDPLTWEEFLVVDRRDKGLGQKKYGQQVEKCVEMADMVLMNNKNIPSLESQVQKGVQLIKS